MTSNSNTGDDKERLLARVCLLLQSVEDESVRFCSCRRLSRNSGWWDVVSVNTLRFKLFSSSPIVSSLLPAAKHSNRTHTLSTAYTQNLNFSFAHIFMQLEGNVLLQRATRDKNINGANLGSCALKETAPQSDTIRCRFKFGTL